MRANMPDEVLSQMVLQGHMKKRPATREDSNSNIGFNSNEKTHKNNVSVDKGMLRRGTEERMKDKLSIDDQNLKENLNVFEANSATSLDFQYD